MPSFFLILMMKIRFLRQRFSSLVRIVEIFTIESCLPSWRSIFFCQRLFDKVSHDIFDAIRKETIEGANYSLRIALLPMDELYNCQGRLGPIVRGDVRFVKHPSPSGGWCLVIDHAGRYFLDQIKASYERLGFWTTITKFRYCHCDECQKNVIMTRYLTIHWNIQDNNHAILEKLIDISNALDAGINVWNCNPNTSKTS